LTGIDSRPDCLRLRTPARFRARPADARGRIQRIFGHARIVLVVGVALVIYPAIALSLHGLLYGLTASSMVLDKNDLTELAVPRGETLYVRLDRPVGVFSAPEDGSKLFELTQRAVVYGVRDSGEWTNIRVFGWVWVASFARRDSLLSLIESLPAENLRQNANGIIIARILPGTELVTNFTSDQGTWYFCRTSGWIMSQGLTKKNPGRDWSGRGPVETDFTGLGGELGKRDRLKSLAYKELPFVVLIGPFGILWLVGVLNKRRRARRRRSMARGALVRNHRAGESQL
jgi:hypothetical protein